MGKLGKKRAKDRKVLIKAQKGWGDEAGDSKIKVQEVKSPQAKGDDKQLSSKEMD